MRVDGYVALPAFSEETPPARPTSKNLARGFFVSSTEGGQTYSYAYGPAGVPGLRGNHYTLASAALASIGGLLFGYDQGVIANVLVMKDFRLRWALTDWQEGVVTAMLEMGALLGALLAGVLADRYSRKHSILVACGIWLYVGCPTVQKPISATFEAVGFGLAFIVGSLFQCAAQSRNDLIIGRAIGGLGIGSLSMLSPLYLAEISPPEVRGSLMALEQFAIVLGVVLGFWTGFFTRELSGSSSWRLPLAIQILPAAVLAFGSLLLPSSPRLLILQGQPDEARIALARLRLRTASEESDPLLRIEFMEMLLEAEIIRRSEHVGDGSVLAAELRGWKRLFSKKYIDRVMVGVMMMFFQQWSGINALIYYGPLLMQRIGLEGEKTELIGSGLVNIIQLLAAVPAIMYIDQLGRKPLLQYGGTIMGCAHLSIAFLVNHYHDSWSEHHSAAWLTVGFVYVFTAAYGISYGPIAWILPSEVLPLSIRSRGAALATASNWFNNFIVGLITPSLLSIAPSSTFAVFGFACFGAVLWAWARVPETAGVSLEEIDVLFKSEAGREDAELRQEIMREVGLEALIRELSGGEVSDEERES